VARQCELLSLPRSTFYYEPRPESEENLKLMKLLDQIHLQYPFFGRTRLTDALCDQAFDVSENRVYRLMKLMGLNAIYPKPKTSQGGKNHRIYPYLLKGLEISRPNQVWCSDITYIGLKRGFMYLVAVMDWYSRYILSWELSNSLEADFCVSALDKSLMRTRPEIFNTDQGAQFTSDQFTSRLQNEKIKISMDGKGRVFDNIFIERFWRSLKYEEIYLNEYNSVLDLKDGLKKYIAFYNHKRRHQNLGKRPPAEVYFN